MPAAGLPLSTCAGAAGLGWIPEGWQGWVRVGAFTQQRASGNISRPFEINECKVFPPGGACRTLTCPAERWGRRMWAWGCSPCWDAEGQQGGGAAWGHQRVKEAANDSSLLPVVLGSSHCLSSKGVRAALSPHGVKEKAETWSTSQWSSCTASLPCQLLARQGTKLLPALVWDEQVSIQENLFLICTWKS